MAVEFIDRKSLGLSAEPQRQMPSEQESAPFLARFGIGTPVRIAQQVESVGAPFKAIQQDLFDMLVKKAEREAKTPEQKSQVQQSKQYLINQMGGKPTSEKLANLFGYTPEQLEPQGTAENFIDFVGTNLPFIYLSGGLTSPSAFGKSVASLAGSSLGSKAGGAIGGALGRQIGLEREGQIAGSTLGSFGGSAISNALINRPSQALAPQIQQEKVKQFEAGKQMRKAEQLAAKDKALQDLSGQYEKEIRQLQKQYKNASQELPKQQVAFKRAKDLSIKKINDEIKAYDKQIAEVAKSRKPLYDQASKLEGNVKGNAKSVLKTVNQVQEDLSKGVPESAAKPVYSNLEQLDRAIVKGELSLSDAKKFQKHFNEQIYDYSSSPLVRSKMAQLSESLNDFIRKNGSSEHNKVWKQAEDAHKKYKMLQEGRKEFLSDKKLELSSIKSQQFSPFEKQQLTAQAKAIEDKLGTAQKSFNQAKKTLDADYKKVLDAIGKETYEDFISSANKQSDVMRMLNTVKDYATNSYTSAAVSTVLGLMGWGSSAAVAALVGLGRAGYNELAIVKDALANHPTLAKEWAQVIKNSTIKNAPISVSQIQRLDKKTQQVVEQQASSAPQQLKSGVEFVDRASLGR